MTKDKERDDALIAEAAEMFPPDTVDVQSRYVIVHQLRASADIQDAQTKRETGWADTSDRACLMRKAADALDALLAIQATEARAQGLVEAIAKDAHDAAVTTDCQAITAERNKERAAPHLRHAAKVLFKVSQALATWRRT